MQVKDIKRLLDVLGQTDVRELTLETGEYKLTVRRGLDDAAQQLQQQVQQQLVPNLQYQAGMPLTGVQQGTPAAAANAGPSTGEGTAAGVAGAATDGQAVNDRLVDVVAPIVGTFYAASSPEGPPYVSEGERVKPGTVLCIIEAMKLMNEIEAEVAGVVREILVENDEPVEYGQVLFRIEPD